jgi:hypothetical protein
MKGVFHCKGCGSALSGEIALQSLKDPAVPQPAMLDQEPVCPVGTGYKSYEPFQRSFDRRRPAPLEFSPQYWLNPEDVLKACRITKKHERTSGCCGISGNGLPNLLCRTCRTEVGTMQADCFTPRIFIPDPKKTEFRKTDT